MSDRPALILIDVQKGFSEPTWGRRCNPLLEKNISKLLKTWRSKKWPVLHVQHLSKDRSSPLHPETPGVAFIELATPSAGELVFQKNVNSAFIGTNLQAALESRNINRLVLIGLTSDHCVSTSARMAANLGFQVSIAVDATATFDRVGPDGTLYSAELVHSVSIASLNEEFAKIVTTKHLIGALG